MLQNKVETVNFRLYFKAIIRQNEIQYFTTIQLSEKAFGIRAEVRLIKVKQFAIFTALNCYAKYYVNLEYEFTKLSQVRVLQHAR